MLSNRGDFLVQDRAARVVQAAWKTLKRGVNPLDRQKIVTAVYRGEVCSISLEPLGSDTFVTPCGHLFKEEYLNEWLRVHSTCPLCRQNIVEPQRRPVEDSPINYLNLILYSSNDVDNVIFYIQYFFNGVD